MPIPAGMSQVLQMQGLSWGDPGQREQAAVYFQNGGLVTDAIYDRGGTIFHVEAFRQTGDTDDKAIQRALNAAVQNIPPSSSAGCIVQLDNRVYLLQNPVTIPAASTGIWIRGAGQYATVLQPNGSFAAINCPSGSTITTPRISDLFCYGGTSAIDFSPATTVVRAVIDNVLFEVTHTAAINLTGGNMLGVHIRNCMFLSTNDDCILGATSNVINNLFIEQCWFQTDRGSTYINLPCTNSNTTDVLIARCTIEGPANSATTAPIYVGNLSHLTLLQNHFADFASGTQGTPLIKTYSVVNGTPTIIQLIGNDLLNSDGPVLYVGDNGTSVAGNTWTVIGGQFTSKSGTAPVTLQSAGKGPRMLKFDSVYFGVSYDWSTYNGHGVQLVNCYDVNQLQQPFTFYPSNSTSVKIDVNGSLTTNGTTMGFYGATAVSQQNGTGNTHTVAAGATTTVFTNTTFDGSTGSTAYTVGDIVKALKAYGLLAS